MKILFILEHFYPHIGGAEKNLGDLALGLIKSGHQVRVVTSNSGGITGKHQHKGIEVYSYNWKSFFGHPVPSMRDLDKHRGWPDIIQTSTYTAAPVALKLAKKINVPVVVMAHEYLGNKWYWIESPIKGLLFRAYEYGVYHKKYTAFIAPSSATKKDMIRAGIMNNKITVVYPVFNNFNEWRAKLKSKHNKSKIKNFVFYGRPGKTKGGDILVDAIARIKYEIGKDIKFTLILSDDPIQNRLKIIRFINKKQIANIVEVKKSLPLDELKKTLVDAYCVVVPSVTEGFGYSAYQACLLGKNIIASDAGSLPEVIFGSALIFKNRDAESLANCLLKAIEGKFDHYQNKIKNNQVEKVINLYNKLIN